MVNLVLSFLLLFRLTAAPAGNTWPGFRGAGDSHAGALALPLEWADGRNVAWNVPLPGYGQSSPVVWKDRVFLTSVEGPMKEKLIVSCRDLKSGRELWRRDFAASFKQKDADIVSKAAPTPAADARRVYVFFESGDLFAFGQDGRPQWQRKLAEEYGGYKTQVLRAGARFEQLAVNTLSEVERVYGVAAVDGALLLRSGRKLIKLQSR